MDNKDIFDILGIGGKEDSYTDLIKHFFDNWLDFKKRFCILIAGEYKDDFDLKIRMTFDVENPETNKWEKILPDMVLNSREGNIITLVESKIFSDEGYYQTARYVKHSKKIKEKLNMPNASFINHKYVTLDGDKPSSEHFTALKWSDIVLKCCSKYKSLSDNRIKLLAEDLYMRAEEYINCPKPNDNECFSDYLKKEKRWITAYRLNRRFMEAATECVLEPKNDFVFRASSSNNRAGRQYLYYIYKHHWVRGDLNINRNDVCHHIHIESNWLVGSDKIKLAVHYETNPYIPQKWFNESYNEIKDEYYAVRNRFKEEFNKQIRNSKWKQRNYYLTIAECEISTKSSFKEIKEWYEKQTALAIAAVDETLKKIN
jgi:hypothetical protein